MRVPDDGDDLIEAPINITNTPLYIEDDADWSPDGQKIVFTRHNVTDPPGNSPTAEICVLNFETSGVECVTNNLVEERAPAWSPDGTRIAYMCRNQTTSVFDICVMDADGAGQTHLTDNSLLPPLDRLHATPAWSPNGEKIVFARGTAPAAQLWLMNANGTDQTHLVISPVFPSANPGANGGPSWGRRWVGGGGTK